MISLDGYDGAMSILWQRRVFLGIAAALLVHVGCATRLSPIPSNVHPAETVAFGRILIVLTGPTTRAFPPELRFFELVGKETGERYRVDVHSADAAIVLKLPPDQYELSRILINEGAFQAMATPGPTFRVNEGGINYIGTWQFGVASPTYDRKVLFSLGGDIERASEDLFGKYPQLAERALFTELPMPADTVTRLYEVDPYPLFWWFRRHHTS